MHNDALGKGFLVLLVTFCEIICAFNNIYLSLPVLRLIRINIKLHVG